MAGLLSDSVIYTRTLAEDLRTYMIGILLLEWMSDNVAYHLTICSRLSVLWFRH